MKLNLGICVLTIAAIVSVVPCASAQSVLTRHVREVAISGEAQPLGRLPAAQNLGLDLVLPLRDPEGLKTFLAELYDPSSASFHHFLTPTEFTARFGPTQQQYEEVLHFAKANGLAVTGGSRDGMEVQVHGSVLAVERAFHVNLLTYRHPTEDRTFYGADREPTTALSFDLWHISGLDNFSNPHPLYVKKSDYAACARHLTRSGCYRMPPPVPVRRRRS